MSQPILPEDDGACGWYNVLPPGPPPRVLTGRRRARFVVLGAGFVGLAAARRLAENRPDDEVLLIEALRVGKGASGRNSGFVIDVPHKRDLEHPDLERKRKIFGLNHAAISHLEAQVERYSIDCQWSRAGKYQAAVGERGIGFLDHYEELLKAFGAGYDRLGRERTAEVLGTSYYADSIFTPDGMLMQPAALCRGLAATMPPNVALFEHSPVIKVAPSPTAVHLATPQGEVRCEKLVLATNVFSAELGFMKHRMIPTMTFGSLTRPLTPEERARYRGIYNWGLTPADHAGPSMRFTTDGRFLFRSEYRYAPTYSCSASLRAQIARVHRAGLAKRFPQFAHVEFEDTWGGVCGLSRNYAAYFGELGPNVYGSGCHQSVGVARGTISGLLLADMLCGIDNPLIEEMKQVSQGPSLLPPDPFLGVGVRVRMNIARWTSRSEG